MKAYNLKNLLRTVGFCAVTAYLAGPALAAPINYGDFDDIPPGVVTYTDVTESTSTDEEPLFGAPTVTVNQLDFDPSGFGASASNGDIDITDGQLNFGFETLPGTGIRSLLIEEGGDYSFLNGEAATSVNFGVFAKVTVTEVDGVTLPLVGPGSQFEVIVNNGSSFTSPGGLVQNAPWSLGTLVELGPALASNGFGPDAAVTAGEFVLNNTLIAASESGSLAFIAKKDFTITPGGPLDPDNVIPEPTAALLAGLALAGVVARRR